MFPDSSGAMTPPSPKSQDNEDIDRSVDRRRSPSTPSTEAASIKSQEPHWDSVIGAATD